MAVLLGSCLMQQWGAGAGDSDGRAARQCQPARHGCAAGRHGRVLSGSSSFEECPALSYTHTLSLYISLTSLSHSLFILRQTHLQDTVLKELIELAYSPTLSQLFDRVARAFSIIAVKAGQRLVPYLAQVSAMLLLQFF